MAAICIGGVCIPYSAILPLIAIAFKWIASKLASLGLLPENLSKLAGISTTNTTTTINEKSGCCEDDGASPPATKTRKSNPLSSEEKYSSSSSSLSSVEVTTVESVEKWRELLIESHHEQHEHRKLIVVKFTADWCKPCHAIQPFYESLALKYDAIFVKMDVDELDEIAQECKVMMMPTFVVFRGTDKTGSVSGVDEAKLENLVSQHATVRAEEKKRL